jgi:hypothetical protein
LITNSRLLSDESELIRAWAIQILLDKERPKDEDERERVKDHYLAGLETLFIQMAADDMSPLVRLYLACRLSIAGKWSKDCRNAWRMPRITTSL